MLARQLVSTMEAGQQLEKAIGNKEGWPLPNMQQVTEVEFWRGTMDASFESYAWVGAKLYKERWATVVVFYTNYMHDQGGGYAALHFYSGKESVEYYRWNKCKHKWSEARIGNCLHEYTCKVKGCGAKYTVDSSG